MTDGVPTLPEPSDPLPATPLGRPADVPAVDVDAADRIERELDGVDRALARLEDGSYGLCQVCQSPIDDAVLEADPTQDRCPAHVVLAPND